MAAFFTYEDLLSLQKFLKEGLSIKKSLPICIRILPPSLGKSVNTLTILLWLNAAPNNPILLIPIKTGLTTEFIFFL